jgi:hypothetical protein
MPRESMQDQMRLVDGISATVTTNEKDSRGQKGRKVSDLAKTIGVVPESEIGSRFAAVQNESEKAVETFKQNSIKEGSLVEVCDLKVILHFLLFISVSFEVKLNFLHPIAFIEM